MNVSRKKEPEHRAYCMRRIYDLVDIQTFHARNHKQGERFGDCNRQQVDI